MWDGSPNAIGQKAKFGYKDGTSENSKPLNDLCRKTLIKAAGPAKAKKILKHFGRPKNRAKIRTWEDNLAFYIVERDYTRLEEVTGIGEVSASDIHRNWMDESATVLEQWKAHWDTDLDNWGHGGQGANCPLCPHNTKRTDGSVYGHFKNRKTMLPQMCLTTGDWHLTPLGNELLRIGSEFGALSSQFKDAFAYCLLVPGRHLRLINELDGFLKNRVEPIHTYQDAQSGFEKWLEDSGLLKRNPGRNRGSRNLHLKSPIQIWNHLGLMKGDIFAKDIEDDDDGRGPPVQERVKKRDGAMYTFDHERITDVLIKGAKTFGV